MPCELYALMDCHEEDLERQNIAVIQRGQFASLWQNCNPNIKEEFRNSKPDDFIPKMRRAEKKPEPKRDDGSYRMSVWKVYAKVAAGNVR